MTPVPLRVTVTGIPDLYRDLARMNPGRNTRILSRGLNRAGLRIQAVAAREKIHPGGKAPPLPDKLTSRTGTLRRLIRIDRDLPFAVEIGTDLIYGAAHEFGSPKRNLPPRPFLGPALKDVAREFGDIIVDEWKREARL